MGVNGEVPLMIMVKSHVDQEIRPINFFSTNINKYPSNARHSVKDIFSKKI